MDLWLEDFLYPEKKQESSGRHLMDLEYIHKKLAKINVTLMLLLDKYMHEPCEGGKISYAYRPISKHLQ